MRFRTVSQADARRMQERVRAAPLLEIDAAGCTHRVARIGYLPSGTGRELLAAGLGGDTSGIVAYFETTDGTIWRLPDGLASWAVDCVATAQALGSPFPADMRFGMTDGEYTGATDTASIRQYAAADTDRAGIGDEAVKWFLSNTFTGNAAAGAYNEIQQRIESVQRLSGKTTILSFWATAGSTIKLGINATQYFGSGGSPSAAVNVLATGIAVTLTTGWARYAATIAMPSIAGKTLGTNGDDSTQIRIACSSGANANAFFGNIGVQSGVVNIWGVQLEIAQPGQTQPSPLEKPDPRYDLSNCQRFYQLFTGSVSGYFSVAGTWGGYMVAFPVFMRALPTITLSNQTYNGVATAIVAGTTYNNCATMNITTNAAGMFAALATYAASADL